MNLLRINDLGNDQIQVSWRRGNETYTCSHFILFIDSLNAEDHKTLQWYLEEYLRFPSGAEEYNAKQVEEKMARWGELPSLFLKVQVRVTR